MLDRLRTIEEKFDQLAQLMSDPGLVSDQDRYRQTTKAYHEMEKIVLKYREFKGILRQIAESQGLLADEELKAMAREELTALEARRQALDADLRALLLPRDPN